jgi:hypothetical protein
VPDLIAAAGFGGGPRVAVFDGLTILSVSPTRLFNDFFIFESSLWNGAFISAGDVDGDGFADIIGGGPNGGPRVFVLSGAELMQGKAEHSKALVNFLSGDIDFRGGVRVTAKDTDGDGIAEIFTGSGHGKAGKVHKWKGNGDDDSFNFDISGADGVYVG